MKLYLLLLVVTCGAAFGKKTILHQHDFKMTIVGKKCDIHWKKESIPGHKDIISTCSNNYTKTCPSLINFIPLNFNVNIVFIDIFGGGVNCSQIGVKCSDKFILKLYVGNKRWSASLPNYREISKVPINFSASSIKFYSYHDTFLANVTGGPGMSLGLYPSYFCGEIRGVTLFYYTCPTTDNKTLVNFGSMQYAPNKTISPLRIQGVCMKYSVQKQKEQGLYMQCYYDGSYSVHGQCICNKGFQKDNAACTECSDDQYKKVEGNEKCSACGQNSTSKGSEGRSSCKCYWGHFRQKANSTDDAAPCYKPPGKPEHVIVTVINGFNATVKWKEVVGKGIYKITCANLNLPCDSPFPVNTTGIEYVIMGLKAKTPYNLTIHKENNITQLIGRTLKTFFNFTTTCSVNAIPGKIQKFEHKANSDGSVKLIWEAPHSKGGAFVEYIIEYGSEKKTTKEETFTIKREAVDKRYHVKIYFKANCKGVNIMGKEYLSEEIYVKGGVSLMNTIIIVAAIVVFIIIVTIASFCIWKRRNPRQILVTRMEDGTVILPNRFKNAAKLYIDPTTYNDVDDAVQEFANEVDRNNLKITNRLGGGEFAEVFMGTYHKPNGKVTDVAIKTLKSGATKRDRDDFLSEAAILGQFSDPNVISLEGVIMKDRPHLIILEYMSNGALDAYLRNNDMQFQVVELLGLVRCVTSGMVYLSDMGFIHRDLAARNILVDEHNVCKVTDFGMSRELKLDDTYETQGGKIPVRWTAPEAIQYKKFTSASDCWSYGILLWEIMSYGERPYWDWGNTTVLERIHEGYRLPPPMNCRKVIHDLMLDCWDKDRTKRPKFKDIRQKIEQWIRSPELLTEIASVVVKNDEALDYTVLETIHKWLQAIGMEQYTELFLHNNYATPKQILELTEEDLGKIGIIPIGHKRKIFKTIQNTKNQVETRRRAGSNVGSMRKKAFSLSRKR